VNSRDNRSLLVFFTGDWGVPSQRTFAFPARCEILITIQGRTSFNDESNDAIRALLDYIGKPPSDRALIELLKLSERVLRICAENNLHPLALAGRYAGEVWFRESEIEHMAECDDPDCDCRCCRLARGWTEEEIEADIEAGKREREEAKQQQADRVRRACRNVGHAAKR